MFKRAFFAIFIFPLICVAAALADCPPGSNWTAAWTDYYNQTTYTLEAPCKVYIGIPFNITATVTDSSYPNDWVAHSWAIKDNGAVISGGGFNMLWLTGGQWQNVIQRTYTGVPADHTIEFKFTDMGNGGGAHNWSNKLIGNITVDPYPPQSNTPPAVNAGSDIAIAGQDQAVTVINGYASDDDGDALIYRWLENSVELQAYQPVDSLGNALLSLGAIPQLSTGTHTLTLEVFDGTDISTDDVRVAIENSPPTVAASGSGTFQTGADILLNGSVSDYDGDSLEYKWVVGTNVLASGVVNTDFGGSPVDLPANVITGGLPLGTHLLTLEVTDGIHTASASITVNVIDSTAPSLAPASSTYMLWPPNHKMVDVAISANASDNSGGIISLMVMVTSNEPPSYDSNGNIIPDYYIVSIDQQTGVLYLQLRAERLGTGTGRTYTVTITAVDESGNSSSANVAVKVPHDMRGN